ncbi:MAG: ribokinase [Acidimicrobiia bacterium]|nr:MAG: ribokinase [Acidimicrobiia bacterium]
MAESTVCVVGSVNLDMVAVCATLPGPGETVVDAQLNRYPGGKGANQALAARRLGSDVTLVAAVGSDPAATEALELLRVAGVDLSRIIVFDREPTGIALIVVDGSGENQIAVASGANMALSPGDIDVSGFDAVLCQFEIRDEVVLEAARQTEGLFCVNTAPARVLEPEIIARADVIIANDGEHRALADQLGRFTGLLVVTHGPRGAEAFQNGGLIAQAVPPDVEAMDTVGAGDAFCGALVSALVEGAEIESALARANAAGAITASRAGAQPAMPLLAEVERLL